MLVQNQTNSIVLMWQDDPGYPASIEALIYSATAATSTSGWHIWHKGCNYLTTDFFSFKTLAARSTVVITERVAESMSAK